MKKQENYNDQEFIALSKDEMNSAQGGMNIYNTLLRLVKKVPEDIPSWDKICKSVESKRN